MSGEWGNFKYLEDGWKDKEKRSTTKVQNDK